MIRGISCVQSAWRFPFVLLLMVLLFWIIVGARTVRSPTITDMSEFLLQIFVQFGLIIRLSTSQFGHIFFTFFHGTIFTAIGKCSWVVFSRVSLPLMTRKRLLFNRFYSLKRQTGQPNGYISVYFFSSSMSFRGHNPIRTFPTHQRRLNNWISETKFSILCSIIANANNFQYVSSGLC